jgi:hypothetical protein
MRPTLTAAVAILLLTAGCGGSDKPKDAGDDPTTTPSPTATATTPTTAPTPTATTPTATGATPATPASTLIDYGDDGITVARGSDTAKLTGAPQDFKDFIAADLQRQQDTKDDVCAKKPEIHVERVDTRGWAAGGTFIPQCGGNANLWAKVAGGWREVWGGQTLPDCAVLEKFRFPASVGGTQCGTPDGKTRRYP